MNVIHLSPRSVPNSTAIEVPVVDINLAAFLPAVKWVDGEALKNSVPQPKPWLWHGYVAKGAMTLLTSLWKSGKTTMVCHLLDAICKAGDAFLGQKLEARKIAIVSEEGDMHWIERARRFDYTENVHFAMRPFVGKPDLNLWTQFVNSLYDKCRQEEIAFVIVDPIANFIPGEENDADSMIRFLSPMTKLTQAEIGVLLLHHPRKKGGGEGTSARGSGALTGFVDIILEMKRPFGDATTRARNIEAFSRFRETPRELTIEMLADESGYRVVGSPEELKRESIAKTVMQVLAGATGSMTTEDILEAWPEDKTPPRLTTLHKVLKQLSKSGLKVDGKGTKGSPYRYEVAKPAAEPASTAFDSFTMPPDKNEPGDEYANSSPDLKT